MSGRSDRERVFAFAGIIQALHLVQCTAHGRPYDVDAFHATLHSIFTLDAPSVESIYGGAAGVRTGLRLMQQQLLVDGGKPDTELTRYVVTLMHLERKLARRPELLEQLRASIAHAERRVELAGIGDAQVLAALARAYTQTVSILQPRIMVSGEPARLRNDAVADQVRALLLAAMRSTVLWRQCGGNRIGLLFGRKRLARLAQQILSEPDL